MLMKFSWGWPNWKYWHAELPRSNDDVFNCRVFQRCSFPGL